VDGIRLTKKERTVKFLAWYDAMLEKYDKRSEQIANRGDFDSSLISKYRKGDKDVGQKVAERAASAFGLSEDEVLKLLQDWQFVPGGGIDATKKSQKAADNWARKIDRIEDDNERERLIETVDTIIAQALKRRENRAPASGQRTSRAASR
jgi:transcriptional regulator with XRE-family HTH domain